MRRSGSASCAALAALIALSGCGSSSSSSSSQATSTRSTGTLTPAQYAARANAVCVSLEKAGLQINANKKEFPKKVREAVVARRHANEELKAIPASSAEKVALEMLHFRELALHGTQEALATKPGSISNKAAGEQEYKAIERARALAKSAGLSACARVV
jgi:hypothetical protein